MLRCLELGCCRSTCSCSLGESGFFADSYALDLAYDTGRGDPAHAYLLRLGQQILPSYL